MKSSWIGYGVNGKPKSCSGIAILYPHVYATQVDLQVWPLEDVNCSRSLSIFEVID